MDDEKTAFPILNEGERGLTKRQYFAACAMQGLCANSTILSSGVDTTTTAAMAVRMADNLIEILNQPEKLD